VSLPGMASGSEPYVAAEIKQLALKEVRGRPGFTDDDVDGRGRDGLRTAGELLRRGEQIAEERRRREIQRRAREKARREWELAEKRKRHIESLIGREEELRADVHRLIAARQPKRYDEAITLLEDLRELADRRGTSTEYKKRLSDLHEAHSRKPSFVSRLEYLVNCQNLRRIFARTSRPLKYRDHAEGGIDGIIKEDKLGLDIICIHAQRWENVVGRPEIQKFAGALLGRKASKGILITTSGFTQEALEYSQSLEEIPHFGEIVYGLTAPWAICVWPGAARL